MTMDSLRVQTTHRMALTASAVSILGFTLVPLLEIASVPPSARALVAVHEPFATIAFGGFAIGALAHAMRRHALERQAAEAPARAGAMAQFAEQLVAVKDLMRSPLQNLVLMRGLLREGRLEDATLVPRFERAAVARLIELSAHLDRYERDTEGRPSREHFDAQELLDEAHAR